MSEDQDECLSLDDLRYLAAPDEDSPESQHQARERRQILREILHALGPRREVLIQMRYGGEKTFAQIGARLDICESAAKQLHERTLQTLETALTKRKILLRHLL